MSAAALDALADLLREDDSVISDHLGPVRGEAVLGELAAAGPRARSAPRQYALLVEAVREGYLLHYGEPRLLNGADDDLRLLAGDYLYALGLERLAELGDLEAVRELADLITISAQLHAEREGAGARPLWLATAVAVAAGATDEHRQAKADLLAGEPAAPEALLDSALASAHEAGLEDEFTRAAQPGLIESPPPSSLD